MITIRGTKLQMQLSHGMPAIYPISSDDGYLVEIRRYPRLLLLQIRVLDYKSTEPQEVVCLPSLDHWWSGTFDDGIISQIHSVLVKNSTNELADITIAKLPILLQEDRIAQSSPN